ncbi:hypothetical protein PY32_20590 [Salmonella enterica subsp. enterica serovar Newport]|nr:hypothetical protein [Salmonella enterica subsp. enterica serovar Newport]ECV7107786.1 hypothetical protein [Salmonella enterica subsp. enterica serovar Newport]
MLLIDIPIGKIESVLKHRIQLVEIVVKHTTYQKTALDSQIYELRKHGPRYFLFNHELKSIFSPNGVYIFVIRSWEPGVIYCAPINSIGGHTSMTRYTPSVIGSVHFAGELLFENGYLKRWTNGSGHYQPEAELARTNLLPHVSLMLPDNLFTPTQAPGRGLGYKNL